MDPVLIPNPGLAHWYLQVDMIEQAILYGFSDYESAKLDGEAAYFLRVYSDLIFTLRGISREPPNVDTTNRKALFDRAVGLLQGFYEYLHGNIYEMHQHVPFNHELWKRVDELGRQPFLSLNTAIIKHVIKMQPLITEAPAPRAGAAWLPEYDIMIGNDEFDRTFDDFTKLGQNPLRHDADFRSLALQSQNLLLEAYKNLNLTKASLDIRLYLFDDSQRPTYVDWSCTSDEYLYGLGQRSGVLSLKQKLGGPISTKDLIKMEEAQRGPKKRSAPSGAAKLPATKRARAEPALDWSMTMDNVDADIRDLYSDAGYMNVIDRPPLQELVTPTTENQEDALRRYEAEFIKRIIFYSRIYFRPESPPKTQRLRDALQEKLEGDIDTLRDEVETKSNSGTSSRRLKEARLSAFSLKFLRTLYMKLLLSSTTPVSNERMRRALSDRLRDWTLFELAWNAADARARDSERTPRSRRNWLQSMIDERTRNIEAWEVLRDVLNQDPPEESEETTEQAEPEYREQFTEDRRPDSATRDTGYRLVPRRPGRTVFFNERAEQRRLEREIADARIRAYKPGATEEKRELQYRYKLEDETTARIAAALAQGGPPDHEKIPTETVYQKIVYMIVLTQWRFFQMREIL